jgi:hypothetical protein
VDFPVADVFDGVRREIFNEARCAQGRGVAAIEQHVPFAIAADEVAELYGGIDARPAVRVDGDGITHGNASIQNSDAVVFEN